MSEIHYCRSSCTKLSHAQGACQLGLPLALPTWCLLGPSLPTHRDAPREGRVCGGGPFSQESLTLARDLIFTRGWQNDVAMEYGIEQVERFAGYT